MGYISKDDATILVRSVCMSILRGLDHYIDEDGCDIYTDMGKVNTILECNKNIQKALSDLPAADVIEVIRCKDCTEWDTSWQPSSTKPGAHFCPIIDLNMGPDDFCCYGERK